MIELVNPCKAKSRGAACILARQHPVVRRDVGPLVEEWDHISENFYWNTTGEKLDRPVPNRYDLRNFGWPKAYSNEGEE